LVPNQQTKVLTINQCAVGSNLFEVRTVI